MQGREPYRQRFADLPEMCARDAVDLATGIIIRSTQMCTTPELLDQMLWWPAFMADVRCVADKGAVALNAPGDAG